MVLISNLKEFHMGSLYCPYKNIFALEMGKTFTPKPVGQKTTRL